jgi:hypothetical protein
MKNENVKKKKPYAPPRMKEKPMTATFMICARNAQQCPPGTAVKALGTCF